MASHPSPAPVSLPACPSEADAALWLAKIALAGRRLRAEREKQAAGPAELLNQARTWFGNLDPAAQYGLGGAGLGALGGGLLGYGRGWHDRERGTNPWLTALQGALAGGALGGGGGTLLGLTQSASPATAQEPEAAAIQAAADAKQKLEAAQQARTAQEAASTGIGEGIASAMGMGPAPKPPAGGGPAVPQPLTPIEQLVIGGQAARRSMGEAIAADPALAGRPTGAVLGGALGQQIYRSRAARDSMVNKYRGLNAQLGRLPAETHVPAPAAPAPNSPFAAGWMRNPPPPRVVRVEPADAVNNALRRTHGGLAEVEHAPGHWWTGGRPGSIQAQERAGKTLQQLLDADRLPAGLPRAIPAATRAEIAQALAGGVPGAVPTPAEWQQFARELKRQTSLGRAALPAEEALARTGRLSHLGHIGAGIGAGWLLGPTVGRGIQSINRSMSGQ